MAFSTTPWRDLRCWLDADGYHVWQSHICNGSFEPVESILPWPQWKVNADKKTVDPSINCHKCGLHAWGHIEAEPTARGGKERE